jgi:hypothetical protein
MFLTNEELDHLFTVFEPAAFRAGACPRTR